MRNALVFLAATGGISVGLRVPVNAELRSGKVPGQPSALNIGLGAGLSMLVPAIVIMWVLSGGSTILSHYVIRQVLARHRIFPWRASTFLDDATSRNLMQRAGGGYSFIHRRLQDYFADATMPPEEEPSTVATAHGPLGVFLALSRLYACSSVNDVHKTVASSAGPPSGPPHVKARLIAVYSLA